MDLRRSSDEELFQDSVRSTLTDLRERSARLHGPAIPGQRSADPDLSVIAEQSGWLELAAADAIRPNFPFAAALLAELGRAAIGSQIGETVLANTVLSFLDPAPAAVGDSGPAGQRVLAIAHARSAEDLPHCARGPHGNLVPEPRRLVVPWADTVESVVMPVRLAGFESEEVALVRLSNPGGRRRVAAERVLDNEPVVELTLPEDGAEVSLLTSPLPAEDPRLWDGLAAARMLRGRELLGHARHSLELTTDHVSKREQFGRTLASMQAVQLHLADMWIALESSELLLEEAIDLLTSEADFRSTAECAAFAAGRAAELVSLLAIHLHGGLGYMWEYDLHWHYRRVKTLRTRLGTISQQLRGVAGAKLPEVERSHHPSWGLEWTRRRDEARRSPVSLEPA